MGKISCRRKEVVVKGNRGAAQGASPANLIDAKRPRGLTRDNGAPRQVKSYRRSWLIDTLKRFRAQLAGG